MAKRNAFNAGTSFETKTVLGTSEAMACRNFGWKPIAKAERCLKDGTAVMEYTMRRRAEVASNPTVKECEAKYAKLQKKKPLKHSGFRIFFTFIFALIFILLGVIGVMWTVQKSGIIDEFFPKDEETIDVEEGEARMLLLETEEEEDEDAEELTETTESEVDYVIDLLASLGLPEEIGKFLTATYFTAVCSVLILLTGVGLFIEFIVMASYSARLKSKAKKSQVLFNKSLQAIKMLRGQNGHNSEDERQINIISQAIARSREMEEE